MGLIDREDHRTTQIVIPQNTLQDILLEKVGNEYPDLRNSAKPSIRFIDEDGKEISPNFMCEFYYDEGGISIKNGEGHTHE